MRCRVKTFSCCGVSLKTGTATIGILGILGTVISIITSVLRKDFASEYRISSYCVAAVALLSSVLLLVATYNETITSTTKRGLLLPWLIFHMIGIIALIVASIAFITMSFVVLSSPYVTFVHLIVSIWYVGVGVVCLIFAPISIYFWIVVRSYYLELQEQNCGELPQRKKEDACGLIIKKC